jgi:anti-sigma B factor antagonist
MMNVREQRVGTIAVVDVSGTVTQEDAESLRVKLARMVDVGHRQIVLDLGELTHLDSSALGSLVATQIRADKAGTTLKIANAGKRLRDLLVLTRLTTVFDCYESLDAAVDSFKTTT